MVYIPSKKDLANEFGEWLNRYKWDWWATWTFRQDKSPYGARKSFLRFIRGIKKDATYFLAIEWHKYRHSVHCHSLVGNVEGIRRLSVMDKWYKEFGIARILPYQKNLGARYYLSKYIVKELADWDFRFDRQMKLF